MCCVCREGVLVVVFSRRGLSWDCGVVFVMTSWYVLIFDVMLLLCFCCGLCVSWCGHC